MRASLAAMAKKAQPDLAEGVLAGDRRALAQGITLVESSRPDHRAAAEALLEAVLPAGGEVVRLGISGAPGVGKSTFIEALGTSLTAEGQQVAVLAVDPSSVRSGGSILGDKTRMEDLARDPRAFIRPSPSGGTLGGVARRSREVMLLCEAAGHDVVIVETVGVGQSEIAVAAMADTFVLLLAPGGGDALQGIKRGIMEIADLIVVNKSDGDLKRAAEAMAAQYAGALGLLRPILANWQPEVLTCSAAAGQGIAEVWQAVLRHRQAIGDQTALAARRAEQARAWRGNELEEGLVAALRADPGTASLAAELDARVAAGELSPGAAAREIIAAFLKH